MMFRKGFQQHWTENETEVAYGEGTDPSVTSASVGESKVEKAWSFLGM